MTENTRRYRADKKPPKKKKSDRLLNYLIAAVVLLIVVVAGIIFSGNSNKTVSDETKNDKVTEQPTENTDDAKDEEEDKTDSDSEDTPEDEEDSNTDEQKQEDTTTESPEKSDTAKITQSNDAVVKEVVEDSNWSPYKTKQEDDGSPHNSSYDDQSVDWAEKISAIAEVTGLAEDDMTVWYMKNGGSADTAVGTVSSKDQTKMYRVTIKWVTKEGWLPTKVELLNQLNGAY